MAAPTKNSPTREVEDEERDDDTSEPRVDEIDPDERVAATHPDDDLEEHEDDDDEPEAEDIDLDDLAAMEGPDA